MIFRMYFFPLTAHDLFLNYSPHVEINLVDSEQSCLEGIILFDNSNSSLMSVFIDRHSHEQHDKRKMITVKNSFLS